MTFHRATQNDIEVLIDLRIAFNKELLGEQSADTVKELKGSLLNYFISSISDGTCIAFIAFDDNLVAGCGLMTIRTQPGNFKNPSGKVGYLMNMFTFSEYRKKGICSALVEQLIEVAKKEGVTTFELHSTKDGESVYKKSGFQIHSEPTFRKYL